MSYPKRPPETHRVKLSATVAPKTMVALQAARGPGEGLGQVIDRAVEALKGEKK